MGVDEVGDRTSEGQAVGVCVMGFTARTLARVGVRDGMQGPEIKAGSDKLLSEIRRKVIERGEKIASGGVR